MLKIVCNLCKKDIQNLDFLFEASIIETVSAIAADIADAPKRQQKTVVHICKDCFDKKLKKEIYGK